MCYIKAFIIGNIKKNKFYHYSLNSRDTTSCPPPKWQGSQKPWSPWKRRDANLLLVLISPERTMSGYSDNFNHDLMRLQAELDQEKELK